MDNKLIQYLNYLQDLLTRKNPSLFLEVFVLCLTLKILPQFNVYSTEYVSFAITESQFENKFTLLILPCSISFLRVCCYSYLKLRKKNT